MKNLYLTLTSLFLAPLLSVGQITYPVNVVNNEFQPDSITITQGDAISWECSEGFHNVDGTTFTYPDNPEGFTSGDAEAAPWTYVFEFTAEGVYHYRCVIHGEEMTGTVVVADGLSTENQANVNPVKLYPNPTEDFILIDQVDEIDGAVRLAIFEISGKKILEETLIGPKKIDLSELNGGIYIYQLFSDEELIQTGKLAKS